MNEWKNLDELQSFQELKNNQSERTGYIPKHKGS